MVIVDNKFAPVKEPPTPEPNIAALAINTFVNNKFADIVPALIIFAPSKEPPEPDPNIPTLALIILAVIIPVAVILPTTVPVVIPTNTLAFVKNKLVFSITLDVYNLFQVLDVILSVRMVLDVAVPEDTVPVRILLVTLMFCNIIVFARIILAVIVSADIKLAPAIVPPTPVPIDSVFALNILVVIVPVAITFANPEMVPPAPVPIDMVFALNILVVTVFVTVIFAIPVMVPPAPDPTDNIFATNELAVTIPVAVIFPTTAPVVIPTNTLVFVKYKLEPSATFDVVKYGRTATTVAVEFATELILPLASIVIF